ncbi:hypothetical protein AALO_G00300480 [Alosa alosa]|uniref:Ig-like domain-containing protein n=1 Tax=Alosa alosa TaxID=278164 RepID=A0AAV6FED4_9TELE|nr:hypothetical protein AALO_G00300480 [Alosa alosa]
MGAVSLCFLLFNTAQLPQPILNVSLSAISKDRCMVELRCTSPQEGQHISWDYIRDPVLFAYSGLDKNDSVLWAYLRADTPTNFTCTISDGLRNSSISKQPSCKDAPCNCCGRHHYIPAVLVTFYLVLLCNIWTVSTRMPIRTQQEETHAETPEEQQEETHTETQEEQQEETHADTQEEQQEETHADTQEEQQEKTHAETPEEQQGETHPETPEEQQEETHTETQEETHAETHEEQEEETHAETQEEQQEKTHAETPEEQQEKT